MTRGILFVDVDGTLVGPRGVDPRVWPALAALREAGWRVAICTGRPGRGEALDYAARVDPDGLHVFESGGAIRRGDGAIYQANTLSPATVTATVALASALGVTLEGYSAAGAYVAAERDEYIARHEALLDVAAEVRPIEAEGAWVRLQLVVARERWAALEADVRGLPECAVHIGESPQMPDAYFVAVTGRDVSKGSAVRAVCAHFGVAPEAAAMAGDNLNDIEALWVVGRRFVVADGHPEALALATDVIPSASEGGVAVAARLLLASR